MTHRALFLVASLLGCICLSALADDTHPPTEDAALVVVKSAEQLYQQGKFLDAADKYQAALKISTDLEAAQLGLCLSLLRAQKTDEALDAVVVARKVHPHSASLMTALGDIQFRRGEMAKAEQAYRSAIAVDPQQAQAYLGLALLYESFSLYAHARENLQRAHELDPKDPVIQLEWIYTLPKHERWSALMTYLSASHPATGKNQSALTEYFQYLQATLNQPPHACRLTGDATNTQTKLIPLSGGEGLEVKVNDRRQVLLLDTGASGITISRKAAEKAKLVRISDVSLSGIGDKGDLKGYLALADRIVIGNWEFRDCIVTVGDKKITGLDGLIGADVFASYLVDIDFPKNQLGLSALPAMPDSSPSAPGGASAPADAGQLLSAREEAPRMPRDRYVAPEMKDWTGFFHFGHLILIPAHINESKPLLFLMDTGAQDNTLSLKAARPITKVSVNRWADVEGVSGSVDKVYKADKVNLRVGRLVQDEWTVDVLELSSLSAETGTEVSGLLGFRFLQNLEIKLDYRDGLVDLIYVRGQRGGYKFSQ